MLYVTAATLALDAVNRNTTILRDYRLSLLANDGMCQADVVMKIFIRYILDDHYGKLVGILGMLKNF